MRASFDFYTLDSDLFNFLHRFLNQCLALLRTRVLIKKSMKNHDLVSVCDKFQLSSWSRSGRKVCGGSGVVGGWNTWLLCLTSTKLFLSCFELSSVELRWVLTKVEGNSYDLRVKG